ncbi:hypothetical protein IAD21_06045 [Abditibacteriota bacterium]|nr:hypothetical protein IAD21_06045 [Abditibacteriota bacterium]
MQLSCDCVGFPVLEIESIGLAVHLLPVSKIQFERLCTLLPASGGFWNNSWYQEVLQINPRVSWRHFTHNDRRLWLTGILPEEAEALASKFGEGFRLPIANQWLLFDQECLETPFDSSLLDECPMHMAARCMIDSLITSISPRTWGDLAMLKNGIAEWVLCEQKFGSPPTYGGIGRQQNTTWGPALGPVPILEKHRPRFFGLRAVRPLESESGGENWRRF